MKSSKLVAILIASLSGVFQACSNAEPLAGNTAEKPLPIIVIDPGHGGEAEIDQSSPNNASYLSEKLKKTIKEKDLTLEISKKIAADVNSTGRVKAILTRSDDVNVGMKDRANVALSNNASALVSVHFNSTKTAHGPVAIVQGIQYEGKPANTREQHARDMAFGAKLAKAVEDVSSQYDSKSKARTSQDYQNKRKPEGSYLFSYLREKNAGKTMDACFLEIEFMDNPSVAAWLLERPDSEEIRAKIAKSIANELVVHVTTRKTSNP